MRRVSPAQNSYTMTHYIDTLISQTLQQILNIQFGDETWQQSTLPVSLFGLGVRSATDLALPTFLASVTASADFVIITAVAFSSTSRYRSSSHAQNAWTSL